MGTIISASAKKIVNSNWFQKTIIAMIVLTAVIVGLETSTYMQENYGGLLKVIDKIIIYSFALEAIFKMLQYGKRFFIYFENPWNIFDFIIVVVCFLPGGDYHFAAILRLARILRVLRLVTAVPKLQLLVRALLKSIPSMTYVSLLLGLHFYVYAVLGVFLWSKNDPSHFADLPTAVVTLFRIITLEDWTDIMYVNMLGSDKVPFEQLSDVPAEPSSSPIGAAIYFISFVVFGTMIMLNLFIGVIINSMNDAQKEILKEQLVKSGTNDLPIVSLEKDIEHLERHVIQMKEKLRQATGKEGSGTYENM